MESRSGLALIALFAHALATLPGSERSLTPTTCTPGSSALTRDPATARPVPARASLDTMVFHANVPLALTTVTTVVLAGLRSTWLSRRVAPTTLLGIT